MKKILLFTAFLTSCVTTYKEDLKECQTSLLDLYQIYKVTVEDLQDCAGQRGGEEVYPAKNSRRASGY